MKIQLLRRETFARKMDLNPNYVRQLANKLDGEAYKGYRFVLLGAGRGEWYAYPADAEIEVS